MIRGWKEINPEHIQEVDFVVGLRARKGTELLPSAVTSADEGLTEYLPDKKSLLVFCDPFARGPFIEAFFQLPTRAPKLYLSGISDRVQDHPSLSALAGKALELNAQAVVAIDSDNLKVTPEWIKTLSEPLFKGYDLVFPLYVRSRYDDMLTNNIVYPMTRMLYGKRVRDMTGGDYGLSAKLAEEILSREEYHEYFGSDLWTMMVTIIKDFSICQSFLGGPKIIDGNQSKSLADPIQFRQTMETLFCHMERFVHLWKNVRWSRPIPLFGADNGIQNDPLPIKADIEDIYQTFKQEIHRNEPLLRKMLHLDVSNKLIEVAKTSLDAFEFPALLWVLVLYDFAVLHKRDLMSLDDAVDALFPIYLGRICSDAIATATMDYQQLEVHIENQCRIFEETKPFLVQQFTKA